MRQKCPTYLDGEGEVIAGTGGEGGGREGITKLAQNTTSAIHEYGDVRSRIGVATDYDESAIHEYGDVRSRIGVHATDYDENSVDGYIWVLRRSSDENLASVKVQNTPPIANQGIPTHHGERFRMCF